MESLKQHGLFRGYQLTIGDSQLLYRVSRKGTHREHSINYEHLGGVRTSRLKGFPFLWITALVLALLALVYGLLRLTVVGKEPQLLADWLFLWVCPMAALLLLGLFFLWRARYWGITTLDKQLSVWFYQYKPSRFEVDHFFERLMEARNAYLFRQYATLEDHLSYEEHLSNLKWLRSIQAIDGVQYDALYRELKKRTDPGSTRIGFSS